MNFRRIGVLLKKDIRYGAANYFIIFAVVAPLLFTLVINLVFGTIFSGKPKLGLYDHGDSQVAIALSQMKSIGSQWYDSESEVREGVEAGKCDMGLILEADFDAKLREGRESKLVIYVWGESLIKHRAMIGSAIIHQIRSKTGSTLPIDVKTVVLGDSASVSIRERLLPMVVLLSIFIAGFVIPATSLVIEKEKRTAGALLTTPATVTELYFTKGLLGFFLSIVMGIGILALNQGFGPQPGLAVLILSLGAVMAVCVGLIVGSLINNIATMYTTVKLLGFFLYGPGIVKLFPKIPAWIGKLFPSYYVMNPIMELTQYNRGWSMIRTDVVILFFLDVIFIFITGFVAKHTKQMDA